MTNAEKIIEILESEYPDAHCELDFGSVFELLVAVILSAQCTDKRVNEVTKNLFAVASTPRDFAEMDIERLEKLIYSCGFYHNKAKNIKAAAQSILTDYGGEVPKSLEGLLTLSGVGRKTANVVSSVAYGGDGIAVDTHVFRVANRLGLASGKTPEEVERGLYAVIPSGQRNKAHHLLIFFGRYRCKSLSPDCHDCKLKSFCRFDRKREDKNVQNNR